MAEETKNLGGRPPKFTDPAQLQEKVNEYFESCEGKLLADNEGNPMLDKYGHPIIYGEKPMTTVGLAYHLGFLSKQSLYDYKGRAAFKEIIQKAIMRIEVYTCERLFDKDGCNGARFSLQNNFKGYNEAAKEVAKEGATAVIINDIPRNAPDKAVTESAEAE